MCDSSHVSCPAEVLRICFNGAWRKQHILFFSKFHYYFSLFASFFVHHVFQLDTFFRCRSHTFSFVSLSLCIVLSCLFSSSVWLFSRCSPLLLSWSLIRIATVRVDVCSDRFGWMTRMIEPCFQQSVAYR